MATAYLSSRLGRAVILMDDGITFLLDVENGETAVECPPAFLRMLRGSASDLSIEPTNEKPPFARTYAKLLHAWRRERTTSLVLLALDPEMSPELRTTAGALANELLEDPDCLAAARARLSSAPLPAEADIANVPNSGKALSEFLEFVQVRQRSIEHATNAWSRARMRVAEYSEWAARLRYTMVRLGGFLAMSDALEVGSVDKFDAWLNETLTQAESVSADSLRLAIAWKQEAFALDSSTQPESELSSKEVVATEPRQPRREMPAEGQLYPSTERMAEFVGAMRAGTLSSDEILSTFAALAPSWLQEKAAKQERTVEDLVGDLIRFGSINLAGVTELAQRQHEFPGLREVWVFARRPLDLEESFYSAVLHNIRDRFVKYYYFVSDKEFFPMLSERLLRDIADPVLLKERLHCAVLEEISFYGQTGMGLMIPADMEKLQGVNVTSLAEDGTIKEAQDMTPSQRREAFMMLRSTIENRFGRTDLPRLPDEAATPQEAPRRTLRGAIPETIQ